MPWPRIHLFGVCLESVWQCEWLRYKVHALNHCDYWICDCLYEALKSPSIGGHTSTWIYNWMKLNNLYACFKHALNTLYNYKLILLVSWITLIHVHVVLKKLTELCVMFCFVPSIYVQFCFHRWIHEIETLNWISMYVELYLYFVCRTYIHCT